MKEILKKSFCICHKFFLIAAIMVGPKTFVLKKVESERLFESKEYFLELGL